jgi:hypothetical protein
MRDPDPIGNDVRRARRRRQLPPDAACVLCGDQNPEVLQLIDASLLERHHVGGKANDQDLEVPLCLNCHEVEKLRQPGMGIELSHDRGRSMPEKLVSVLRGLALFCELLARRLISWADRLAAFVVELDGNCPAWRELEAAQG